MRRPDRELEIIEVLDPDDPSLGWQAASPAPAPGAGRLVPATSRRRWPLVVGAVAAAAAVVAVVVTVVSDDPAPAPPPELAAGRYLVADPSLRTYSADIVTPPSSDGRFVLLAAGGPAEPWVTAELAAASSTPPVFTDAAVEEVNGQRVIGFPAQRSRYTVVDESTPGWRLTVTTSGLSDVEAAATAGGTTVDRGADGPQLTLSTADGVELHPVANARSQLEAVLGTVVTEMSYLDDRSHVLTLHIATGRLDEHVRTLQFLSPTPVTNLGGRVVAALPDTGEPVVLWEQDGFLLSLSGQADPAVLVALSRTVRQATEDEWHTRLIFLRPDYRLGPFAAVAGTGDGSAPGWVAGVQRAERGGQNLAVWRFSVPSVPGASVVRPLRFDPSVMPFVDRLVIDGLTYVFVSVPVSSGVTDATVYVGDARFAELRLTRPFPDLDALVGAVRVEVPGEVRVFAPGLRAAEGGLLPDPLR